MSTIRALTLLIFFPPFPKCYGISTLSAQEDQALIEEELTFEELVVLRTIAQAKAETEISQVGLWCRKIVNSYLGLDLDLEHFNHIGEVNEANTAEPGINLSAQLPLISIRSVTTRDCLRVLFLELFENN